MDELYKNIRARRHELGMSQEELAKKMGYTSRSTIAKIESGRNDIPQSKIKAFAEALQTTPTALLGLTDQKKQNSDLCLEQIIRLYQQLSTEEQKQVLAFMETLASKAKGNSPAEKLITMPVAARGPQESGHTLTQEEFLEAENTRFEELTPKDKLPEF